MTLKMLFIPLRNFDETYNMHDLSFNDVSPWS